MRVVLSCSSRTFRHYLVPLLPCKALSRIACEHQYQSCSWWRLSHAIISPHHKRLAISPHSPPLTRRTDACSSARWQLGEGIILKVTKQGGDFIIVSTILALARSFPTICCRALWCRARRRSLPPIDVSGGTQLTSTLCSREHEVLAVPLTLGVAAAEGGALGTRRGVAGV